MSETEIKKVSAAKKFYNYCKNVLVKSNMLKIFMRKSCCSQLQRSTKAKKTFKTLFHV